MILWVNVHSHHQTIIQQFNEMGEMRRKKPALA